MPIPSNADDRRKGYNAEILGFAEVAVFRIRTDTDDDLIFQTDENQLQTLIDVLKATMKDLRELRLALDARTSHADPKAQSDSIPNNRFTSLRESPEMTDNAAISPVIRVFSGES